MANQNNTSKVNKQGKGKKYRTQIEIFNKYLSNKVATTKMVSTYTGLPIEACCRFKSMLQKKEQLQQIVYKPCKVTGHYAWFLSTDESRFTEITDNQLNIFNNK